MSDAKKVLDSLQALSDKRKIERERLICDDMESNCENCEQLQAEVERLTKENEKAWSENDKIAGNAIDITTKLKAEVKRLRDAGNFVLTLGTALPVNTPELGEFYRQQLSLAINTIKEALEA